VKAWTLLRCRLVFPKLAALITPHSVFKQTDTLIADGRTHVRGCLSGGSFLAKSVWALQAKRGLAYDDWPSDALFNGAAVVFSQSDLRASSHEFAHISPR
jgi:hypothetical protein